MVENVACAEQHVVDVRACTLERLEIDRQLACGVGVKQRRRTAGRGMKRPPGGGDGVSCPMESSDGVRRQYTEFHECSQVELGCTGENGGGPHKFVDVPLTTGTLLQVGLEEVWGARALASGELGEEAVCATMRVRGSAAEHLIPERRISGDDAPGQRGVEDLDVRAARGAVLAWRANLMPDLDARIPQGVQDVGDEVGVGALLGQYEQVDV
jgi:hypothetical protein